MKRILFALFALLVSVTAFAARDVKDGNAYVKPSGEVSSMGKRTGWSGSTVIAPLRALTTPVFGSSGLPPSLRCIQSIGPAWTALVAKAAASSRERCRTVIPV